MRATANSFERLIASYEEPVELGGELIYTGTPTAMSVSIRADLVAGRAHEFAATFRDGARYESAVRRCRKLMCDGCKHGSHSLCESENCPCVCNDSDFRWARKQPS